MATFAEKVTLSVKKIPVGKVVSYGQIAAALGSPRAARQVGWALHSLDDSQEKIPWWRVVNNRGYLSIRGNDIATKDLQQSLLEKEGIKVSKEYVVDMKKYRYQLNKGRIYGK